LAKGIRGIEVPGTVKDDDGRLPGRDPAPDQVPDQPEIPVQGLKRTLQEHQARTLVEGQGVEGQAAERLGQIFSREFGLGLQAQGLQKFPAGLRADGGPSIPVKDAEVVQKRPAVQKLALAVHITYAAG
jgi:hypothetical protein